jgi:tRNA-dihydrouridine synthase B
MKKITNVTNPIILAPMAGYTDLPFRLLCKEFGADVVITEMISAKGLYYKDKKTKFLMVTHEDEKPVGLQIFGSEPEIIKTVITEYINNTPFDFINFNAGCPAPKIVKNGEGAAIMKHPELLYEIVSVIREVSNKPVTLKMRLGFEKEHINVYEIAKQMDSLDLEAIMIHGRTREEFYTGHADWEIIREVKAGINTPVIANGDIDSPPKAAEVFNTVTEDGIMVGRKTVGRPWLFREIRHYLDTGEYLPEPTDEEKIKTALRHLDMLIEHKPEHIAVAEMRKHLAAYTKGMLNASAMRTQLFKATSRKDVYSILSDSFS